jgi:hypothetical protein
MYLSNLKVSFLFYLYIYIYSYDRTRSIYRLNRFSSKLIRIEIFISICRCIEERWEKEEEEGEEVKQ